jgi:hypothetical protein
MNFSKNYFLKKNYFPANKLDWLLDQHIEERGCINLSSSNWMDRQLQKRKASEILHLLCIGTSFPNTS